jgi:hypothetical protein
MKYLSIQFLRDNNCSVERLIGQLEKDFGSDGVLIDYDTLLDFHRRHNWTEANWLGRVAKKLDSSYNMDVSFELEKTISKFCERFKGKLSIVDKIVRDARK